MNNNNPQVVVVNSLTSPKSKTAVLLLCIFLGVVGGHCFYAGKVGMGILYLFTGGLCGIGALIDFIKILTSTYTDGNGLPIRNW
jgi:TM2 domain.